VIPSPPFGLGDLVQSLVILLPMTLFFWFFGNGKVPLTPSILIAVLIVVGVLGMGAEK
jgi:hypothetical protein